MTFNKDGIYRIEHAYVPVRIALAAHSSDDGTPIIAWNVNDDYLDHMWLIKSVPGETDTYTIRNTVGGSYMDLTGSSAEDGTPIIGFHKTSPGENQKWIIKKETSGSGHWKIQNKATHTFVDLLNGGSSDGTKIVGWQGSWNDGTSLGHQHWTFSPQSLLGHEVHTILRANPYLRQDFKSYKADGMYLILSRARLQEIWRNSGLSGRRWREEIFDCDDFAFVYKAAVAKWGDDQFKADGFAIICGTMFGTNARNEGHAYNWMINPDNHSAIVFFEPQNNSFMDNPGYNAYFGVF
ncbi:Moa, A lectin from the mushroom marasmius Oreades in complex with the trisaccharide Galgalglcnac [Cubamyces sp. BRFM 1775]|nr:Moa, A lectin from the mushroom marasmius Oreades in complex with the trisaccharide Galgalglcnac [Cubamyces sp. BRFM 1775]